MAEIRGAVVAIVTPNTGWDNPHPHPLPWGGGIAPSAAGTDATMRPPGPGLEIALVADEHDDGARGDVGDELVQPVGDVVEGLLVHRQAPGRTG